MASKARQAARDRAFTQKKPGRPPRGVPLPLLRDERRFEIAFFYAMAYLTGRATPVRAAELAAAALHPASEAAIIDGGIQFIFKGGVDPLFALDNRRDKILREAPTLIRNAAGDDLKWLLHSANLINTAFNTLATGDAATLRVVLRMLHHAGWEGRLARIFTARFENDDSFNDL